MFINFCWKFNAASNINNPDVLDSLNYRHLLKNIPVRSEARKIIIFRCALMVGLFLTLVSSDDVHF